MKVEVKDRQSILDIALQVYGNIESAFILAKENGLEITDDLDSGRVLEYSSENIIEKSVVTNYVLNRIYPVTMCEIDINNRIFDETFDLTFE